MHWLLVHKVANRAVGGHKWFVFHDHHCGLEVSGDMLAMWREAGGLQWRDVMLAFPTCQYN